MSYYVKRFKQETPGGYAWIGPIRSARQAYREAEAWVKTGTYPVYVVESSREIRREVRSWQRAVNVLHGRA
jgi:hypothetical protein